VEALVIRWKRVGAFAVGIVVLHAAVSVFVFDAPMRTPPTVVEANARFRSRQPHSLSYGPVEPIFTWLYPSWVLENGGATSLARSRIVIVVKPEAEVQRAIYNRPTDYRDDDFFPLTRYDFIGGKFYADLETSTVFQLIETYRREPHPLARTLLFAGLSPPFPLNALLHPEIRVYERIDPLREK
ncbi:MAG: hypothetical protein O3A46_05170, partial [Candidatus Poribacteria bacterium]|nr:hypothetical protein [Candidatus Poribacteria bacterium]